MVNRKTLLAVVGSLAVCLMILFLVGEMRREEYLVGYVGVAVGWHLTDEQRGRLRVLSADSDRRFGVAFRLNSLSPSDIQQLRSVVSDFDVRQNSNSTRGGYSIHLFPEGNADQTDVEAYIASLDSPSEVEDWIKRIRKR